MADDIDIEEHDVLDNPRIKNIFPDLASIKTEILDSDDDDVCVIGDEYHPDIDANYHAAEDDMDQGETNSNSDPYQDVENPLLMPDFNSESHYDQDEPLMTPDINSDPDLDFESSVNPSNRNSPEVEYQRINNKIILGSKPHSFVHEEDQNSKPVVVFGRFGNDFDGVRNAHQDFDMPVVSDNVASVGDEFITPDSRSDDDSFVHPKKIILGSKPNTRTPNLEDEDEHFKVHNSVVVLEDWGERLANNPCFCVECEILFPTVNAMDFHKMAAHSLLVALDSPTKNTARKSTGFIKPSTSKSVCPHCDKVYINDNALIKHLTEIVDKKLNCGQCDDVFKSQSELSEHMTSHVKRELATETSPAKNYYKRRLNIADSLKCYICGCVFKDSYKFKRHMRDNHMVINPKFDVYSSDKLKCTLCNDGKVFSNGKNLCHHIRALHYSLYKSHHTNYSKIVPVLVAKKSAVLPKQTVTPKTFIPQSTLTHKYQCLRCHEMFSNQYTARKHRVDRHAELKNKFLFKKIIIRKSVPSICVQKQSLVKSKPQLPQKQNSVKLLQYKGIANPPIPKSILFKCNTCQIHFTNCSDAMAHAKVCLKFKGDKCQRCHRVLFLRDKAMHEKQHLFSDKFVVHLIRDDIEARVLNRCPKCKLYFHDQEFWAHCKGPCSIPKSAVCNKCQMPIHATSMTKHKQYHVKVDFQQSDLILIEYALNPSLSAVPDGLETNRPHLKRKMAESLEMTPVPITQQFQGAQNLTSPKKVAEDKIKIYYCTKCECCFKKLAPVPIHSDGRCLLLQKSICKVCGLLFLSKNHKNHHEKLKLSDYVFQRYQDGKVIGPPIPTYPKCTKCGVQACRKISLRAHECTDKFKICKYCKGKFTDLAYKIHVPLHEYKKKLTNDQAISEPELPELLKKYEKLTQTWNILYLCQVCDIVCDSYDKAVEHGQKHYNNMESYDVNIKQCGICDFKFDEKCFQKHKELHKGNDSICKESFNIIKYDYTDLLNDEWFKMFNNLPDDQTDHILSTSVYKDTRMVKLTLIQDGTPETTEYKCFQCNKFVHPDTLINHKLYCNKNKKIYACNVCGLPFSSRSGANHHETIHENGELSLRIVLFNHPADQEFNKAMADDNDLKQKTAKVSRKRTFKEMNDGDKYDVYKCIKCQNCFGKKWNADRHDCIIGQKKPCPRCGLYFRNNKVHYQLHKKFNFLKNKINIIPYSVDGFGSDAKEKIAKIFKCACGLHFTSKQAIVNHFEFCSPDNKISKSNCGQCGLLFPTNILVSHLCSHHSNDKYTEFEVELISPSVRTVFKCTTCQLLLCDKIEFSKHIPHCSRRAEEESRKCSRCDLPFYSIMSHILRHKNCNQLKENDYNIVTVNKRDATAMDLKKFVYRCRMCDIHYMTEKSVQEHFRMKHRVKKAMECPHCGLKFPCQSLTKHITEHHVNLNCQLKDLQVISKPALFQTLVAKRSCTDDENSKRVFAPKKSRAQIVKSNNSPKNTENVNVDLKSYKRNVNLKFYGKYLYKCRLCPLHFMSKKSCRTHMSDPKHDATPSVLNPHICNYCGLAFTLYSLGRHIYVHHNKFKLRKQDLKIIGLNSEEVMLREDHTKRDKYNFAETRKLKLPVNKVKSVQKKKCKTKYIKTTYTLSAAFKRTMNLKGYSKNLYHCCKCGLYFNTFGSVNSCNHDTKSTVECEECGFKFSHVSLARHMYVHHEKFKLKREDLTVVNHNPTVKSVTVDNNEEGESSKEIKNVSNVDSNAEITGYEGECINDNEEPITNGAMAGDDTISKIDPSPPVRFSKRNKTAKDVEVSRNKTILYRCECGLHFYNMLGWKGHMVKGVHGKLEECNVCGLSFTAKTLHKHLIHHNESHSKRDFEIRFNEDRIDLVPGFDASLINTVDNACLEESMVDNVIKNSSEKTGICASTKQSSENATAQLDVTNISQMQISVDAENIITTHTLVAAAIESPSEIDNYKSSSNEIISKIELLETEPSIETKDYSIIDTLDASYNDNTTDIAKSKIIVKCESSEIEELSLKGTKDFDAIDTLSTFDIENSADNDNSKSPKTDVSSTEAINISVLDTLGESSTEIEKSSPKNLYNNYLFRCNSCQVHYLKECSLESHGSRRCSGDLNHCEICGLGFSQSGLKQHKYVQHERLNLTLNDFKIISFTRYDGRFGGNYLYKCQVCDIHFTRERSFEEHFKSEDSHFKNGVICSECGLKINKGGLSKHRSLHHDMMHLKRENFVVLESNSDGNHFQIPYTESTPTPLDEKTITPIKRKQTGKYFTNQRNLSEEYKATLDISRYCNKVYRCGMCDQLYISPNTIKKHFLKCGHVVKCATSECSQCGLSFNIFNLALHIYIHHEKLGLKKEDMIVVQTFPPTEYLKKRINIKNFKSLHSKTYDKKLYVCACGLHFMKPSNILSCRHYHDDKSKTVCQLCGLAFTNHSLLRHKYVHHDRLKLKLEDLQIINILELTANRIINKSTNKVDESYVQNDNKSIIDDVILGPSESEENTTVKFNIENATSSRTADVDLSRSERTKKEPNMLFKCSMCSAHFGSKKRVYFHVQDCDKKTAIKKCPACDLNFTTLTLNPHRAMHHEKMKLSREDFHIIDVVYTKNTVRFNDSTEVITVDDEDGEPSLVVSNSNCLTHDDPILIDDDHDSDDDSTLKLKLYSSNLFKCKICSIHFMTMDRLQRHVANPKRNLHRNHCTVCGLEFSVNALAAHIFIHHETMKISSFKFTSADHIDSATTTKTKISLDKQKTDIIENETMVRNYDKNVSGKVEPSNLESNTIASHNRNNDNNNSSNSETYVTLQCSVDSARNSTSKIYLFKCGVCNVHFLEQPTCYEHTVKHQILDPKKYIECKICSLQFGTNVISKHVDEHHDKDFNLEDVIIEEYEPLQDGTSKINIYNALDKVQSRLVSTTTDRDIIDGNHHLPDSLEHSGDSFDVYSKNRCISLSNSDNYTENNVNSIDDIGTSHINVGNSTDNIGDSMVNIGNSAENIALENIGERGDSTENIGTSDQNISNSIDYISMENIGNSTENISDSIPNIVNTDDNIGDTFEIVGNTADNIAFEEIDFIENIGDYATNIGTSIDNIGDSLQNIGNSMDNISNSVENNDNFTDRICDSIDDIGDSINSEDNIEIAGESGNVNFDLIKDNYGYDSNKSDHECDALGSALNETVESSSNAVSSGVVVTESYYADKNKDQNSDT